MAVLEAPKSASRLRRRADHFTIPCARRRLDYRGRPLVMGVLNVTPDSFSDGGRFAGPEAAVRQGLRMAAKGADLIDIGGESTKPGARSVPLDVELQRVIPVIRRLAREVRIPISVDTSKAEVAFQAVAAGASLINDVTALRGDGQMAAVAARNGAALILMHMRGIPRTMQGRPRYDDVVREVAEFLLSAAAKAEQAGIERSRILMDPGLGFGKTVGHNLELLKSLGRFVELGFPVVVGPSRKSFIGNTLDAGLEDRLAGTLACVAHAFRCGAHMVRVHDVQPVVHLLKMLEAIELS